MLWVRTSVYSMQHYVIKLITDFRQIGEFLRTLRFSPPIKMTATIWLSIVAFNIKTIFSNPYFIKTWVFCVGLQNWALWIQYLNILALYTIYYLNDVWNRQLFLIELILYFCVTKNEPIRFNIKEYSVLYDNSVRLVIYDDWYFTHMWKTIT